MTVQPPVLKDLKILDFGHYVAGPVAAMLFADFGADVLKVEPPTGPALHTAANAMWNRGKRRVTLDLREEGDRATARALIAEADIVIENFRPGVMAGWGLSDEDVRATNPGLIYVSMPGFAPGDARASLPAWEGAIYASLDAFRPYHPYQNRAMQVTTHPDEREGAPLPTHEHIASVYAAIMSANCVMGALLARRDSGLGQRIEVPLFEAMMQGVGVSGAIPIPAVKIARPSYTPLELQYECADGRWFHMICSIPRHGEQLLRHLGRADLVDRGMTRSDIAASAADYAELLGFLTETMRTATSHEWEALFVKLGLPGARCNTLDEWLGHEALLDSDLLVEVAGDAGLQRQPNCPVLLTETASGPSGSLDPILGAPQRIAPVRALDEWRASRESRPAETDPAALVRAPLSGLRVLDLCIILAGPASGRTLAEFGADVIKIDDPVRGANAFHEDVNRAKSSIFLDLRDPDEREAFWSLAEKADVILQNFRIGVLDKYGITEAEIRKRNPRAIFVSTNAYGDKGPWAHLPGYEGSIQAATGLQARYSDPARPSNWLYAVHDYATGYLTAFGTMLAIYERSRTGRVFSVHAALARTASLLQSAFWMEKLCPPQAGEATPRRFFDGIFACKRGWIYLAARDRDAVAAALGSRDSDADASAAVFCASRTKKDAIAALNQAGLAACELVWIREAMQDPLMQARGVSLPRHNYLGQAKCYVGPGPWMSASRIDAGPVAQPPGSGARAFRA